MRDLRHIAGVVLGAWCWCASVALAGDEPGGPSIADQYVAEVRPVLAKYCFHCHSGSEPEGNLSLDSYRDTASILGNRKVWLAVAERLNDADMPPEGEPRPTTAQSAQLADWVHAQLDEAERRQPRDPGRVTIRRLNRTEYNNTIRDLVGLDFQPADDFPADDVGYGFDNIGDVLSMPPILLEKYLTAAQSIVQRAIVAQPPTTPIANIEARQAEGHRGGQPYGNGAWEFASQGNLSTTIRPQTDGPYLLKITAFGQQAGPEPARMAVDVDGKKIGLVDIVAVEAEPQTYELRTDLKAGDHRLSVAFVNDYYQPQDPNPANRDRNLVIERIEVDGPLEVAYADLPATHRRIIQRQPAPDQNVSAAGRSLLAREALSRFATRAYRRPVTAAEADRLVQLFQVGEDRQKNFAEAIQFALEAVLVSPHFLFRLELDPDSSAQSGSIRSLGDYEVATRLSYFLWSSIPDEELFAAAAAGQLRDSAQRAAQARRMLQDSKSRALVENFAGQWLQLRNLKTISPDKNLFPDFDDSLRAAMREESERFFAAVVSEDRSVLDFLNADFTFVNERLARHYGIEGVQGNEFRRISIQPERRGGVLTQASVLTVTSNPTRTSPVKRGRWVLDNLLGAPPPPPPAAVPELDDSAAGALHGSLRERMQQHREKAECAVCHNRMDPIGFGLENYDAIGAWRTHDGTFAIDPSGTLPGGKSFSGPADLKQILKARQSQFVRCLAEKLLTYALGRGLEDYDRIAVSTIVDASAKDGYRFSSLLTAVIQSDPFLKCRTTGANP